MNFENNKAIYEQMADRLCDDIIAGVYKPDDRVPSVREYAALMQVNTNTAVKAYELLAREDVIYNRRGLGYFVSNGAPDHIVAHRRRDFMQHTLPELFRQMRLLGIGVDEVVNAWQTDGREENTVV